MPPLLLLGFLDNHHFIGITNTLAFIWLRLAICTNLGGNLTDLLLIRTLNQDFGLGRTLNLHTCGHLVRHRVRKAERQIQGVTLSLGTITNANQLQLAFEALGYAGHHVAEVCTHGAPHGTCIRSTSKLGDDDALTFDDDTHCRMRSGLQRTERPLDDDLLTDGDFNTARQHNRILTNTRYDWFAPYATMHRTSPPTLLARALRSVITPFGVETMATPRPFMTRGMSSQPL